MVCHLITEDSEQLREPLSPEHALHPAALQHFSQCIAALQQQIAAAAACGSGGGGEDGDEGDTETGGAACRSWGPKPAAAALKLLASLPASRVAATSCQQLLQMGALQARLMRRASTIWKGAIAGVQAIGSAPHR